MLNEPSSFRIRKFNTEELAAVLPDLLPKLIEEKLDFTAAYEAPAYQFVIHVRHIRVFDQLVRTVRAARGLGVEILGLEEITVS